MERRRLAAPPTFRGRPAAARPQHPGRHPELAAATLAARLLAPAGELPAPALLHLQRAAGNRAVSAWLAGERPSRPAVQRDVGWKDASTEGRAWNLGEQKVGTVRRIPLQGLKEGLQKESAKVWNKKKKKWQDESTMIEDLSSESAKGKAVVLVPSNLKPEKGIEVIVHLHGFTESKSRPFAGWRELSTKAEKNSLRKPQGLEPDDVAPVRDVALDQVEQQLQDSGLTQTVIVLPQGGLHSQFGKEGDYNFDAGAYVGDVVRRLVEERVWKAAPEVARVSLSGHSGGGMTLGKMALESLRHRKPGDKPGASSGLTGDLVLFDAITASDLDTFEKWVTMRLNEDRDALQRLTKDKKSEADKLAYLRGAQKLRGYYSAKGSYVSRYQDLEQTVNNWFADKANAAALGALSPCLRANFAFVSLPVRHEELMRGVRAGKARDGAGGILDALRGLHPPEMKTAADCAVPTAAKPTVKPAVKSPVKKRKRSRAAGAVAPPSPVPAPASPAPAPAKKAASSSGSSGGSRAKQIAKAILLAKTGGEGHGKTKEERAASKAAAEATVAHDIEAGAKMTVDAWFEKFEPEATFLGKRIRPSSGGEPPGVHHELAVRLTEAEGKLVKPGENPADAAQRLGVKDVAGLRVPKTPTGKSTGASMHCFGLAVDIDHDNNPFIGNVDKPTEKRPEGGPSIRITLHATLLLAGEARDPRRAPPALGDHETDSAADREARAARAVEQWKLLSADSMLVQQYLSLSADDLDKLVQDRMPALTAWKDLQAAKAAQAATAAQTGKKKKKKKKPPAPPPWVEHVADPAWWRDEHARDVKQSMSGDFGRGETSDPTKFGFMTLREELVRALVLAGLSWGGAYLGDKDVMHFDLRTGSIQGRAVL